MTSKKVYIYRKSPDCIGEKYRKSPDCAGEKYGKSPDFQQKGTHTGVVVATTPVVERPVHRYFRRKREKGTSFCKVNKKVQILFYYL